MIHMLETVVPRAPSSFSVSQSRSRVFKAACFSRLVVLFGIMLSCRLIPNHDPGEGVLRIDLRLSTAATLPFALKHGCDSLLTSHASNLCASTKPGDNMTHSFVQELYRLMLPPLTRWDAARFLSLALDPNPRSPSCRSDNLDEQCSLEEITTSEQAHAFFPMLPFMIRLVSTVLLTLVPIPLLPSTLEGVMVLAAWWVSTSAFVIGSLVLFELTYCLVCRGDNDGHDDRAICLQLSETSAFLFCINPASVFFSTAYSESLFACFSFAGYVLAERHRVEGSFVSMASLLAILCWAAASYTRSNGAMVVAWIVLQAVSDLCSRQKRSLVQLRLVLWSVVALFSVVFPGIYHDSTGVDQHCRNGDSSVHLTWCLEAARRSSFSLYGHVQRKHWNVGFLRYYQWKQLPNFLLAFPILFVGFSAGVTWLRYSWDDSVYQRNAHIRKTRSGISFSHVVRWALESLRAASDESAGPQLQTTRDDHLLLVGPSMLAYYAVLVAACLLGGTVAHVQISTRLICSSCPAIYWYMAYLCHRQDRTAAGAHGRQTYWRVLNRECVICYCVLYTALGILLHVNWLPWT